MRIRFGTIVVALGVSAGSCPIHAEAAEPSEPNFARVLHILKRRCGDCHTGEAANGGVSFDRERLPDATADRERWDKTLRMLRSGLMPPRDYDRVPAADASAIVAWVKRVPFGIDPQRPDPGHTVLRRLNRIEYRNTIRDLLGIEFDASVDLPPDNSGHGFDNVADALTMSPLLLEKYIAAATAAVGAAIPQQPFAPREVVIPGHNFKRRMAPATAGAKKDDKKGGEAPRRGPLREFAYYEPATATYQGDIAIAGQYRLTAEFAAFENFVDGQFDYNKCRLKFRLGGEVLLEREFVRQGFKKFKFDYDRALPKGPLELSVEIVPLTPNEPRVRNLRVRLDQVTLRGPMAREHWVRPAGYAKHFPKDGIPADPVARRQFIKTMLADFAKRAFRRPVDASMIDKLVGLAEATAAKPDSSHEAGVARAMVATLSSPRFLFREESSVAAPDGGFPLVDEHALAARLSYWFWSTMPDAELTRLADAGRLRAEQTTQVQRLLADPKAKEFIRNFVGQWLQTRNVDAVNINAFAVLSQDEAVDPKAAAQRERFRELRRKATEELTPAEKKELDAMRAQFVRGFGRYRPFELNGELRRAMREETDLCFEHILREDRSLLELLDADYTFLNERLAKHYGIRDVTGDRFRKVTLPKDSVRGGVLTQGSALVVSSNPNRTSPVKRGLYILENILGMPPPPPPPNISPLEDSAKKGDPTTLRETLARHRADAKCASCHNRLDPLGLAFENFNALGRFREKERGHAIDAAGELLTGERFKNVRELKRVLTTTRRLDYYRCVTEKLFTYALGRAPEPTDVDAIGRIVERLDASGGKPSVLLAGLLESPAFQRLRDLPAKANRAELGAR